MNRNFQIHFKRVTTKTGHLMVSVIDSIKLPKINYSTRSMIVADTPGEYTKVPLFSWNHKLLIYQYCATVLKFFSSNELKNALVLGGGGGTVPLYLLQNYSNVKVDIIEKSITIIKLSKKYFLNKYLKTNKLTFIQADALQYQHFDKQYDFVFCDLFIRDCAVPFLLEDDFIKKLHRITARKGILIINAGSIPKDTDLLFLSKYGNMFQKVYKICDGKASVYLCCNREINISSYDGIRFNKYDRYYLEQIKNDI